MCKTKLISVLSVMTLITVAGMTACERPDEMEELTATEAKVEGRTNLEVRLMDAPSFDYDMVNIDIQSLWVYIEPEATGQRARWFELTTSSGNYNMLKLVNGNDVLLAAQWIPPGRITQMAMEFGDYSNVVVDGRSYRLVHADGVTKRIFKVDHWVTADAITPIMLDFDVARSIFLQNDAYVLRPVIRGIALNRTGSIHGRTEPVRGSVAIFANNGIDQYTTFADYGTGEFLLRGIPPGRYTVMIYYPGVDRPEVHDGIRVTVGTVSELSAFP